jgi:hypothetical protein
MLDSTPIDRPRLYLRSPFTGEAWPVPPDVTPDFVEALLQRGFTRIPSDPVKSKRKSQTETAV